MLKKIILAFTILVMSLNPLIAVASESGDTAVKNLMALARKNITKARMSDGKFVPTESADELKKPIVPFATGKRVVRIASNAATAQWCGLEWKDSYFHPFLKGEKEKKVWTEKQIAYISLLHGLTMGAILTGVEKMNRKCSTEDRSKIEKVIAARDFK